MRIGCLYAPEIALQAALRRDPDLRDAPVALADGPHVRSRILATNAAARRAGVRPGLTAGQAKALGTGLRVLTASPADVDAARAALADVGFAFAPRAEADGDRVYLEVGDLLRLYPSEQAVAQGLQAAASRVGLAVRVAVASSKAVARTAARAHDLAIVPEGGERAHLASLPVRALDVDPGALETLARWGIETIGRFAALPAAAVALRLGAAGARLHRHARGLDDDPFVPRLPQDAIEEATDLDWPIHDLEPLSFVLRGLLDRALARLACRSLGCAGITLRLRLDPRGLDVRTIPIAAPTREASTLLDLVRLDLSHRPPDAAIVGAAVTALPARVRSTQLDLLRPAGPAPDKLAAVVARLGALVGPENVGPPSAPDAWSPDDAGGALTMRRFRPPEEVEVLMGRQGPTALRGLQTTARVLVAAGPYRTAGGWWQDAGAFDGDGWDVQASDGAVYRLRHDRREDRWFLDGYYD